MNNPIVSDPNDFKVVEFFNSTNFDFTPELGAMYDGRPLFVGTGERRQFPYHVGHRLAVNLAKAVLIKGAPLHDPNATNPVGTPLWGDEKVKALENSFLKELYTEEKPIAMSQTDLLMAKVEKMQKDFEALQRAKSSDAPKEVVKSIQELVAPELTPKPEAKVEAPKTYLDKSEVIAELTKRNIKFDARQSKVNLEKLLA